MRFGPDGFEESGEAFVEPDVGPVFAGDEVAEPLMGEFVGNEVVGVGGIFGDELGIAKGVSGVGGGAGIFHAAGDEVVDHDLRVFFPGIVDADFFVEELDHRGRAFVVGEEAVAAAFGGVVGEREAAERLLDFVEFAGDDGDEIGRAGLRFAPGPGFLVVAGVGDADELAVGDGDP